MLEELAGEFDLNGEWLGYYEYNKRITDQRYPITAILSLHANRINGKMIDGITDIEWLYKTVVESLDDRMGIDAKANARMVIDLFPRTTLEHSLPRESDIRGKLAGERVSFTKYYLGKYTVYANTGWDKVPVAENDDHRVKYSGTLNIGKAMIQGEWSIRRKGLLGWLLRPEKGEFVLFKKR